MKSECDRGTVIVTGAGSGIGYVLTNRLLQEGYAVSAWDVKVESLRNIAHPRLSYACVDVSDREAVERAAGETVNGNEPIAGLVACAAIFKAVPFLELEESVWDATFAVNLKGTLFACQAVLSAMRRQKKGSIVLFASAIARAGAVNGAHYASTKGGVMGLMRSLALETAADGIRVNAISPGLTDTPQPRGNAVEDEIYARAKTIPLGRIGRPEDMAEAALFLLSDESSFVTGQDIRINGGAQMF
jgi:2-hydroxycyclohexanecarboxyl-CoA dehydrogenase